MIEYRIYENDNIRAVERSAWPGGAEFRTSHLSRLMAENLKDTQRELDEIDRLIEQRRYAQAWRKLFHPSRPEYEDEYSIWHQIPHVVGISRSLPEEERAFGPCSDNWLGPFMKQALRIHGTLRKWSETNDPPVRASILRRHGK